MMGTCKECKYFTKMTENPKEPKACFVLPPWFAGYEDDVPLMIRFPCPVRAEMPSCEKFKPLLH